MKSLLYQRISRFCVFLLITAVCVPCGAWAKSIYLDAFHNGGDAAAEAHPTTNWEDEYLQEGLPPRFVIGGTRGFRSGASNSGDPKDSEDVASSGYSQSDRRLVFRSYDKSVPGSDVHDGLHFTATHRVSWGDSKDLDLDPFTTVGSNDPVIELFITNATIAGTMTLSLATDLDGLGVVREIEKPFKKRDGLQRIVWKLSEFTSSFTDDIDYIELSTAYYTEDTGNHEDMIEMSEFILRDQSIPAIPDGWEFEISAEYSDGMFNMTWRKSGMFAYHIEQSDDGVNWNKIDAKLTETESNRLAFAFPAPTAKGLTLFRIGAELLLENEL